MTTLEIYRYHFKRMWKERHTSAYARHCVRQNINGQRKIKEYMDAHS